MNDRPTRSVATPSQHDQPLLGVLQPLLAAAGYVAVRDQLRQLGGHDEMHIVVVDTLGRFTRNPGSILEKYEGVSRATDAKAVDGGSNFYQT
jgi:hypothetical protein